MICFKGGVGHLQDWGFGLCVLGLRRVSSGYFSFLPESKDMYDRLIGISKLSLVPRVYQGKDFQAPCVG